MTASASRRIAASVIAVLTFLPAPALTQSVSNEKAVERPKGAPAENAGQKDLSKRRADEIAEAGRLLTGPAANPECVWFGRRVVNLLWRDDIDTAFRHLDLYDRFGCPGAHIQSTFRCMIRQGDIDQKSSDSLNTRVHMCWINPALPSQASNPPEEDASKSQPGTSNR